MNFDLSTALFIITFICVALFFVPWAPPLALAISTLALAIVGFIYFGWAWQLLLLLLISAIHFTFWWALRQRSR